MTSNSRDLQFRELKDTIKEQNAKIDSLIALLEAANKREQVLQEQIDFLTKKLFGKSSEKRSDDIEGQLSLFNEAEVEAAKSEPDPSEEEFITIEKHTRKRNPLQQISLRTFLLKRFFLMWTRINASVINADLCLSTSARSSFAERSR